ncbi:MAG: hypothetical protein EKK40_10150 [Bradyrhizobiaceae bacterium]|nr:MAG: hypothetical protein EKK40_10150 [Bradyrhizobiaceae bacterium]
MSSLSRALTIGGVIACGTCAALLAPPAARAADDLPSVYVPPIDIDVDVDLGSHRPPRIYDPRGIYAGVYPGMPPGYYGREIDRPLVAPDQIAAMLRSTGFSLLGPINRRGWVYTAAVLNRRGDDGRIIIDARTGAIIRFLPAFSINERTDRELTTLYGPPGPPMPPPSAEIYHAPRPPAKAPKPKLASRTPSSVPLPHAPPPARPGMAPAPAAAAPTKPPVIAAAPEAAKPAETQPAEAKPAAPPPAPAKPAEVELKPTQDMPPMQTLE